MRELIQLTLDFLTPAPAPASASGAPSPPDSAQRQPVATIEYRHPRANREVLLAHALVAYEFRRGKRRTVGFSVGPDGLVVSAPRWLALADVQQALQEKSAWILRKLEEVRHRDQRIAASRIQWRDGADVPYLGQPIRLHLDPAQSRGVRHALEPSPQAGLPPLLKLGLPHHATEAQIRDAVQAWLMREARRIFTERLNHFAPGLGVQWRRLALSSAGTRWGSARSDGSIRLHWRLVHFRMDVIDYVVVHELSHLRVMDHSPRFWDTVRSAVPDYAQVRQQLKEACIPPWD